MPVENIPVLPIEVKERIIDIASYDPSLYTVYDFKTLGACALTCRTWVHRSRFYLFDSVDLSNLSRASRFMQLLDASPALGAYVKVLIIHADRSRWESDILPASLVSRLTCLRRLKLVAQVFRCLPALTVRLGALSTLTSVHLEGIVFSSADGLRSIIFNLPGLSALHLIRVFSIAGGPVYAFADAFGRNTPCLTDLRVVMSDPYPYHLVDFSTLTVYFCTLQSLSLEVRCEEIDALGLQAVFQAARDLRHLEFALKSHDNGEASLASIQRFLALSLTAHLETLKVTTSDDGHPWLLPYLDRLPSDRLSVLEISFVGQQNIWELQDMCKELDDVVASPKFATLGSLRLGLNRGDNDWDDNMDTPEEWRSSANWCFPKLHSRGIVTMSMLPW